MTEIIIIAGGLLYGLCLLFAYRQGMRDAQGEKKPVVALQMPHRKPKAKPATKEELEAAKKQRRIDEFRG